VEFRRILLDGYPTDVVLDGDSLVARDGRRVEARMATHLPGVADQDHLLSPQPHFPGTGVRRRTAARADVFSQAITALNAHGGAVVRPSNCHYLNFEGEIAIVIGRTARNIAYADAAHYIAGYTIANDFGLHDFRDTDAGSMLRVKGADTFCPVGPGVVTDWDFTGKRMLTLVGEQVRQDGSTDEMAWDMHYLVADIARLITLVPGDIILSGTPAVSRPVQPGDVVSVEVEGLGTLTNHVVEGPTPVSDEIGAQPTATEEVLSTALGASGVPWPTSAESHYREELPFPRVPPKFQS